MKENKGRVKATATLEIITGAGLVIFWAAFFTVGLAPEQPPECYFVFERSFPLPDLILALCLFTSGIMILKGKRAGTNLSLACAGALIFLGLLDFSFNIRNGMYSLSVVDSALNIFINTWCVLFGVFIFTSLRDR